MTDDTEELPGDDGDIRQRIRRILRRAHAGVNQNPAGGIPIAREACDLAREAMDEGEVEPSFVAESLAVLAMLSGQAGRYDESLSQGLDALALLKGSDLPAPRMTANQAVGVAYLALGHFPEALKALLESLRSARECEDQLMESSILTNLGIVYNRQGDYHAELATYNEALNLRGPEGEPSTLAIIHNNAAMANKALGDLPAALASVGRGLAIASEAGERRVESFLLSTLAETSLEMGEPADAEAHFLRCLEIAGAVDVPFVRVHGMLGLGRTRIALGQTGPAIEQLGTAATLAEELGLRDELAECHRELSTAHRLEADFEAALAHVETSHRIKEELFSEKADRRAQSLRILHQVEESRREAERQREKADELQKENIEKDEFLSRVVDHIHDGLTIDDREGRVVFANDRFLEIFGIAREDLSELMLEDYVAPGSRERVRDYHGLRVRGEQAPARFQFEGLRTDGSRVWVDVSAVPVVKDGETVGTQATVRDITREKAIQEQLRQAQKMEAMGRLAGGVAHDFNNLLTTIGGYSQLVLSRMHEGNPLHPKVREIRKAADMAASLTRQLLVFSRRQVLEPLVLDLNSVIENMEQMIRRLIGEDVRLVTELDRGLEHVLADEGQIEQVILNLVVNARDAMPEGGTLTITTQRIPRTDEQSVVLTVTDTGCGMDEGTQARMFEPFFTTKGRDQGTGLGLATVYGIVTQSGGVISARSGTGEGTTFIVRLPRSDADVVPQAEPTERIEAPGGAETILLVEDSDSVRLLTEEILGDAGYRVLGVDTAEKALRTAKEHEGPIHVLLTDVILPGMNGADLAGHFTSLYPGSRVLIMSGYTADVLERTSLDAGLTILEKPFGPDLLLRRVREALSRD